MKNNVPRYLIINFSKADNNEYASDDDVLSISQMLLDQNKEAYEVLAKWKTNQRPNIDAPYIADKANWWQSLVWRPFPMGYRTSKNSTQRLDFYHGAGECEKRGYAHDGHTPIKFQVYELLITL